MNKRTLLGLVIAGVIALAAGLNFGTTPKTAREASIDTGKLMFPGLTPVLKDATRVEISSKGKTTVIALKNGV